MSKFSFFYNVISIQLPFFVSSMYLYNSASSNHIKLFMWCNKLQHLWWRQTPISSMVDHEETFAPPIVISLVETAMSSKDVTTTLNWAPSMSSIKTIASTHDSIIDLSTAWRKTTRMLENQQPLRESIASKAKDCWGDHLSTLMALYKQWLISMIFCAIFLALHHFVSFDCQTDK